MDAPSASTARQDPLEGGPILEEGGGEVQVLPTEVGGPQGLPPQPQGSGPGGDNVGELAPLQQPLSPNPPSREDPEPTGQSMLQNLDLVSLIFRG